MATLDVLTLAEAKGALKKVVGPIDETVLAGWITGLSERLDGLVGPVVQRAVTEVYDGGEPTLYLRYHPISSVTRVVEYSGFTRYEPTPETFGSAPADAYLVDPYEFDPQYLGNAVHRRIGGFDAKWARGRRNVQVEYVAGRFATTAVVGQLFKRSVGLMLVNAWRSMESTTASSGEFDIPFSSFPTFAVPKAVRELLAGQIQDPLPL